jgi:hypothetical protein
MLLSVERQCFVFSVRRLQPVLPEAFEIIAQVSLPVLANGRRSKTR